MDGVQKQWLVLCALIFAYIAAAYETGMAPLPAGKRQRCPNEGEPVTTKFDAQINDCYSCMCKNGYVECKNNCPRIDECHLVVENGCCKICKGCTYQGISYQSHTEWTDPLNPCKVLRCEAGIITVSDLQCYTSCPNPLPPEPGKCCKTCPDCKINGQIVAKDRDVVSDDDPCLKCRCTKGRLSCSKKACPVLQCPPNLQYKPPRECCPRCNGTRHFFLVENACPIQKSYHREAEVFKPDKCTECTCLNSTSVCLRSTCPVLDCAPDRQKTLPLSCCPICIESPVGDMTSKCFYRGNFYEDGNIWQMDACSSCRCDDGKIRCIREQCNTTCTSGMKMIQVPGECCPKCIEVEGACMAFGDPHYKTFDGKIYTFKGIGKYQLIEDCANHTFSIKVANDMPSKYMDSTITKRVAINFGNIRLNLQQRLRVKYNGEKISVPYRKEGQFRVNKIRDTIEVRLQNDVVIVWNGRSFLEVTVPSTYKGKLCGLCGNFNGNVQDDLRTKSGRTVGERDLLTFGSSWCIGKKSECAKKAKPSKKYSRGTTVPCQYLTGDLFSACESTLSNSKYYKACKMDMSTCANLKCYCESLMAYSRECERLGVKLSNWQKHSKCDSHSSRRISSHHHRGQKVPKHSHSSQTSSSEELLRYPQANLPFRQNGLSRKSIPQLPIH